MINWIIGIVGALGVAPILMFLNDADTRAQAHDADEREIGPVYPCASINC